MSQRSPAKRSLLGSSLDASRWRSFLSNTPPLTDLIEIRRLHDNKTILRRLGELPPTFSTKGAEWRPGG